MVKRGGFRIDGVGRGHLRNVIGTLNRDKLFRMNDPGFMSIPEILSEAGNQKNVVELRSASLQANRGTEPVIYSTGQSHDEFLRTGKFFYAFGRFLPSAQWGRFDWGKGRRAAHARIVRYGAGNARGLYGAPEPGGRYMGGRVRPCGSCYHYGVRKNRVLGKKQTSKVCSQAG